MVRELLIKSHRGAGKVVFSKDPRDLIQKIIALIETEEEKNHVKGRVL